MRLSDSARRALGGLACAAAAGMAILRPAAAAAQDTTTIADSVAPSGGRFRVAVLSGVQHFDRSAALKSAPTLGLRVSGTGWRHVSVGVGAVFARPTSRGDYFPWNRQPYYSDQNHRNDTTLLFQVSQRVTVASYGADVGIQLGGRSETSRSRLGGLMLDLGGGAGAYTIWLDPEQTHGNRSVSGFQFSVGGGLGLPVGNTSVVGVRLDDVVFTNYDRDRLSLSDPLFRQDLFRNPERTPPPEKSTIHNLRLSVLFSYIPGAR